MEIDVYYHEEKKEWIMVIFERGNFAKPLMILDEADMYKVIGKLTELEQKIMKRKVPK